MTFLRVLCTWERGDICADADEATRGHPRTGYYYRVSYELFVSDVICFTLNTSMTLSLAACPSALMIQFQLPCFTLPCLFLVHFAFYTFYSFPSLLSRSARSFKGRCRMDIIRSDKSRCRPPKSEWSLDDRTEQAVEQSGVG